MVALRKILNFIETFWTNYSKNKFNIIYFRTEVITMAEILFVKAWRRRREWIFYAETFEDCLTQNRNTQFKHINDNIYFCNSTLLDPKFKLALKKKKNGRKSLQVKISIYSTYDCYLKQDSWNLRKCDRNKKRCSETIKDHI